MKQLQIKIAPKMEEQNRLWKLTVAKLDLWNKLQTKDSTVGGSLNYRLVDSMTMDFCGTRR